MTETLNIVTDSEVLLSIAVLRLVFYGINLSTLKMLTGVTAKKYIVNVLNVSTCI